MHRRNESSGDSSLRLSGSDELKSVFWALKESDAPGLKETEHGLEWSIKVVSNAHSVDDNATGGSIASSQVEFDTFGIDEIPYGAHEDNLPPGYIIPEPATDGGVAGPEIEIQCHSVEPMQSLQLLTKNGADNAPTAIKESLPLLLKNGAPTPTAIVEASVTQDNTRGMTLGMSSGLLDQLDYEARYRFLVSDLSRCPSEASDNISKSIQVIGTNSGKYPIDNIRL
jgi:hypothetical protein